jgi:8-amino-7-oxononanoate synthase
MEPEDIVCQMAVTWMSSVERAEKNRARQGTQRDLPKNVAPLSFADNDYLGLARHPRVIEAAIHAIRNSGTSARAARHLAGPCPEHARLEKSLAQWKKTEAALVFASGYQTPLGVIPSLVGPKDTVLLERNAHACLFDGARLSGARLRLFSRNDADSLAAMLTFSQKLNPDGKILIVAESLHSMDGDFADLQNLVTLKNRFGAWLLLDEAHASGLIGPDGAGWAEEQELAGQIEVQMGTLGKALGSSGGFVAARGPVIDHFLNQARTFLFGTAPAPAAMAAADQALQIIRSTEGADLRKRLQENIGLFSAGQADPKQGPIQTRIFHSNDRTLRARDSLRGAGIEVAAIRPPTVPQNTARLRISLSARHSPSDIRRLLEGLAQLQDA